MPLLSVIIPVYNEKDTVLAILDKVRTVDIDKEIIIIDDCSTDGSEKILADLASNANSRIKVIFHKKNKGKGAAIRTALDNASGDIVIVQDADLELDPDDYPDLIKPIVKNEADVVFGVRKHERLLYFGYKWLWYTILGRIALGLIHHATNILYPEGMSINDVMTGYKVMPVAIMKSLDLKSKGFDVETEICAKVKKHGYRIKEVPVKYYPRTPKEGKKIKWWHTWFVLYALLKYKFVD